MATHCEFARENAKGLNGGTLFGRGSLTNSRTALFVITLGICVGACSAPSTTPAKRPSTLALSVVAHPSLNPDESGRPSPVLVKLFELKSGTVYGKLDYFTLERHDKASLGQDLLVSEEFVIRPNQTLKLVRNLHPDAGVLGVFVGYRDLGKATWRAMHTLPPAQEATWYRAILGPREIALRIGLGPQGAAVTVSD